MITETIHSETIHAPDFAKPLKDRKDEAAQNVNYYCASIKAKKINRIYWHDDLQELYQNLHELFYLTKDKLADRSIPYGKKDLITCINEWLNHRDVKKEADYGINLSLAYIDALITKAVIKP